MNAILYVAIARGDQSTGYQARFPDLPQIEVQGVTPSELLANARTAAGDALQGLANREEEWPTPTPVERIAVQPPEFTLLVDVEVEDTPVRVNISLGEQLLKRLDAAAAASGSTRSGFIAQSVRARLGERPGAALDFEAASRKLQDELTAVGRKINDSLGPDSAFSRSMAEFDDRVSETIRKAADNVSQAMARRREAPASPHAEPAQDRAPDA